MLFSMADMVTCWSGIGGRGFNAGVRQDVRETVRSWPPTLGGLVFSRRCLVPAVAPFDKYLGATQNGGIAHVPNKPVHACFLGNTGSAWHRGYETKSLSFSDE